MARLAQQFRSDFVNLKNSPIWNDLSKEEQQDITQKAKLLLQVLHERDSFPEMNEAQAIAETEQQFIEKNRADQGAFERYVTAPLYRGASNLGANAAKLAAFGLDVAGEDEAADEMRKDATERQQVANETAPGLGKSYSELSAGDLPQFITDVVGENLPTMLTTGLAGRAISGSKLLTSLLPQSGKAAAILTPEAVGGAAATYGLMSLPEVYTSVKESGGGAGSAALFAAPHAIIENLSGITPTNVISWFKRDAAKKIASKGLKNFLFDTFKGVLGEGGEEVVQGMVEMAARHFSTKPYDQAVKDFAEEVTSPEAIEQMKTEFAGGAAFGVAGGGVGAVQRYADIQQKRQAIAQRKGGREFIAKVTKVFNADTSLSEQMTELKKMYAQETEPGRKEHIMQAMQQLQRAKRGAPSIVEPSEQAQNELLTNLRAPTMQRQAEDAQGMAQNQAFAQSFVEPTPETGTLADYFNYRAGNQQPASAQPVESYAYPTGVEGLQLMVLDDLERRQQPNQSIVYDPNAPENRPLLPYQPAAVEGRQLPDGGIVKESKNDDIITLKSGEPFKSQKAVQGYQTKNNLKASHDIVATRGGFVLMKKAAQQQAKRITVETPRGGDYNELNVRTEKNIPTENRTRFTGTPGAAERIEKRLTPQAIATEEFADQATIKQPAPVIEPKAEAVQPALTKPVKQPAIGKSYAEQVAEVERLKKVVDSKRSALIALPQRLADGEISQRDKEYLEKELRSEIPENQKLLKKAEADLKAAEKEKSAKDKSLKAFAAKSKTTEIVISDKKSIVVALEPDGKISSYNTFSGVKTYLGEHGGFSYSGKAISDPAAQARILALAVEMEQADNEGKDYRTVVKPLQQKIADAIKETESQAKPAEPVNQSAPVAVIEPTKIAASKSAAPTKAKADKIEDFGEVLHGARKLYSQEFADRFSKSGDLAAQPFSQAWPEPDYKKLIESGMDTKRVSFLRALRDSLPAKPKTEWKLRRWLPIANSFKEFAGKIVAGEVAPENITWTVGERETSDLRDLAMLYEAVGHDVGLKGAVIRHAAFFNDENGNKLDAPVQNYAVILPSAAKPGLSNWGGATVGRGKTKADAIADFKKRLPDFVAKKGATPAKRAMKFLVYQRTRGEEKNTYFIAYKVGGKILELKTGFATGKEALDYRDNNRAELEAIVAKKKELQAERRLTNQPRIGLQRRTGNITPKQFADTFGFRGVQFGNWVEGDKRQADLNEAYDALIDIAEVLNLPPKALSLNGELGLAFGSRGHGGKDAPLAHYEPGTVVINLTKNKGAGSIAHEWFHALDNYFGKGKRAQGDVYASEGAADFHRSRLLPGRDEMKNAFHNLMKTIKNSTKMEERGKARDAARSKPYWSTDLEIAARSFESYIIAKLSDAGINNDYVANIVSEEAYQIEKEDDYPYLRKNEIESVKYAFDGLFSAIQQEKTDKGIMLYSFEYLVANYAAKGLKEAAKVVRAGFNYMRTGLTRFADWAKVMLKQFGKSIGPKLRAMFADLTAVLQSRRGMIRMGSLGKPGFQPMKVVAGSQMSNRDFENIQGAVFDDDYVDEQPFLTPKQLTEYRNRRRTLATLQFDERTMLSEGRAREEIEEERQAVVRRAAGGISQEEREELARFRNEQAKAYAEIAAREIIEPVSQRAKEASEAFFKEWSERFGGRRGAALNLGGDAMAIFLNGATKFADWARALVKKYGKSINGVLKNMWTSVNNFAKSLGRTGAISGRTVAGKFKAKPAPKVKRAQPVGVPKSFGVQSKDLQWVKDNKKQLRLVYNGQTVATLERKVPGGWRWAEANKAWARNELTDAKTTVKSTIFEELKRAERESAKYKAEADKRQKAEEARNKKHDDYFMQPTPTAPAKPKLAFKERIKNFIVKAGDVLVDRWGPALRLQQQVAKNAGIGEVGEGENFYRKLELLTNRISNRTEQFKTESFEPIVDYLNKNKISYEQFNRFLRIMHAEERNNHVFEINPEFRRRAAIEPDNPNYAGSGITTKEARAEIERMKQDGIYDTYLAAGKMYWDLNKTLLNMQVKYGLMAPEVRDTLNSKYQYYAPLKSMTEDSTKLDWRALGRRSESSDQLAHTEKAIEATFSYGENARVRRAFARFAINHPMPGLYEINRAVKKPYFDENTGEVKYRLDQYEKREELLFVPTSTGGLVMRIKDPALLAVLKNQNDLQLGDFPGPYLRSLNRFLGAVNTSVNPEFMFVNLLRDIQTAAVSLSAEESSEMAANVVLGIPGAAITAYEFKAGENNADVALYKEFMRQGGKIGYRDIYKLENAAEKLKARMAETQAGGTWFQTKEGMKAIRDLIVDANDVIESATRFSAYKEARNMGMSKEKAGSIAANVTLNFQKRGTAGQILNAMYLFSTASIGGSARVAAVTAKAATSKTGKALISGAIAFGFMIDIINRILSDIDPDDDRKYWDKISAGEKDMNYMIMLPGQKENPLKLPMPHGFNMFPAIGRNISAMLFGEQTAYESVGNVMNTLRNAFSPIGTDERGIAYSLIPTAVKAPADVMLGRKWTGKRVRPDQPQFNAEMPRSQLINKDTNKMLVGITQALNAIDGDGRRPGTLDFSAADIQYLIEHYLGGAGKTVTRGFDVLWRIGTGQEIPPGNVPFVRRFYGSNTDFEAFDTFKKNRDEVERYNAAKREDDKAWMQANKWLSVAKQRYSETDKRLGDIKKDATLDDDQKRDAMMIEQKRFNRDFEKIRRQYQGTNLPIPEDEESRAKPRKQRKRPASNRRKKSVLFM